MANKKRTYEGVYNSLKQISDEEGVDFGLDGMSQEQFKSKYFTGPGNIENLYNRLTKISDEEGLDFGQGSRDEWLSSFGYKRNTGNDQDTYKYLTLEGKRVGGKTTQQVLSDAQQTLNENQRVINRMGNQEQRMGLDLPQEPIRLGENRKVTKGQQRYNIGTGQMEQTYITPSGNEYGSRELADMEQNAIDQSEWERNNPKQALKNRIDLQLKGIESRMEGYEGQWVDADGRVHYSGGSAGDEAMRDLENARHDLMEARLQMDRTEQLHKSSDFLGGIGVPFTKDFLNNWKNFGYAVWDRLSDVGWWEDALSGGVNDLEKAGAYMKIKNKLDSGQQLTDQEMDVVLAGMATAQAEQYIDLPMGYTTGEITADMAPFMAQMAVNPAAGFGRALARQAVRRYGRHGIAAVSKRVAARVLGNLGEAAVLSNTLQAPRTIGNVLQRYTGDSFVYDEDGNVHMGHYEDDENGEPVFVEGGKGALRSAYEGEVSSIIENFTELGAGGSVNKFVKRMANSKAGRALGIGYLSDLVGKVGSTPFAKQMKKFRERTHWDGMIEEPLEEEYGIILNSILGTGDNKISDLWDSELQAQIFAGTLWFGGMMSAMNTAAYPLYRRKLKQQVAQADINGQTAFGEEWDVLKEAINNMDDKEIGNYLYSIKDNNAFNNEQKAALFGYAARLKQQQGSNVGDMLMRMEGNLSPMEKAEREAYEAGAEAETPDEKKKFIEDAVKAEQTLSDYGKEFSILVTSQSDNPGNTLDYLLSRRDLFTDEQIAAAADYYTKMTRAAGVMDAVEDSINMEVERANGEVRANTHQETGSVVMAQSGDIPYYIIGGGIVDAGNGNITLAGTGGAVVVKNAETGEISVMSPERLSVVSKQNADELIQQNETVLREQLMQQADDDITYGSPASEVYDMEDTVTLQDGQGGTIEGQVVALPNAIDGVYVVQTSDGKALQLTADELNRRIINHNGVEVKPVETQPQPTEQGAAEAQQPTEAQPQPSEQAQQQNEQPSAISRIPVKTDASGNPMTNRNGRPVLEWHKASVEDASAALIETTGGDMLMARDTATDLINRSKEKLEKIRKQKPKGDDPMEIAERRMEIRRQEKEQQDIIRQWQNVNQHIQNLMREEEQRKAAEREAAKSEEQRQREAEEARIRKEQQDEQDRRRLHEQIERDREKRNKEYEPLTQAKREMADDAEALAILSDTEPRSLEEWVSSLLRPHSILWKDASDSEIGLQTELGMKRADMQRMMSLLGNKESGAKPFGQVVLDIHEGLSDAMKEQYTDQDVRNTLLNLFNEGSSTRMLHLTEENRIEEARQLMKDNQRREAESEMDAWCDAYHLTPEERETFEDYLTSQAASEPEQEIINNIIADESYRTSQTMDQQPVGGTDASGADGSQGQVQQAAQTAGTGTNEETVAQAAEAQGSQQTVADNNVPGAKQSLNREYIRELFGQIGADAVLADRISDYEVEQLTAMVEDWEVYNDDYGYIMEQQKDALKSKDKRVRDAAQKKVDEAQQKANEVFTPIEEYVEGLNAKYGIESEQPFEGAIPTPKIDGPRAHAIRENLMEAYKDGDPAAIAEAAKAVQQYVDEGLDFEEVDDKVVDIAETYEGNDPQILADEYIVRVLWDRYLDNDSDQEYIRTGLKKSMRHDYAFVGEFEANENGVCTNPHKIEKRLNNKNINEGFAIYTAQTDNGWVGGCSAGGSTYGWGTPVTATGNDRYFETEQECQAYWAQEILNYFEGHRDKEAKNDPMAKYKAELHRIAGKAPVKPAEQVKPVDLRDAVRVESPEIGVSEANAKAREAADGQNVKTNKQRKQERKQLAKEIFEKVLSGQINSLTLQQISEYINSVDDENGEHISERLPQGVVREIEKEKGIAAVDALYSRISESGSSPSERTRREGRERIEELKKRLLKQWAQATGNWYTDFSSFTDSTKPFASGTDSKEVFLSKDGHYVIKLSHGKPFEKRWRPDIDNVPLFNYFFPEAKYEILGYGEYNGEFVRILRQPVVDVAKGEPVSVEERVEFMDNLGFKPMNKDKTAFSNGEIIISDVQKSNILKDADGDIYVIDADIKLHTKDIGGRYTIPPVEQELPQGTTFYSKERKGNSKAQPIGPTSTPEHIAQEEKKVDTNPTEAQKEAGNYQKGHINIDGYDITIENPKGSVRRGRSADGTEWETLMNNTYGYIRGTEGVDGDHIDVFLSDNPASGSVFVVDQVNPETGQFDEHKVMYGFASEEKAREAYLSNYSEGWQGLGAITEVSREEFKKWVESSHRKTKPFAEYKSVKPAKEHKRLVSDDKMEELRKQLLAKMNNTNVGIDPERMLLGAMYAVGKIERGFTKFADYAQEMVNDLGDMIRPYLKSFYNAVRDMPEAQEYADQMDDYDTVQKFDVFNFDKGGKIPTAFEKAEQVTKEQKVKRQAKKIKQEQPDLFRGDLFGEAQPQQTEQPKRKTAWWSDPNRPTSLDPSDYRTYTTDEAKAYFAQFKSNDGKTDFTKWAHPNLAYITAAAWDGAVIPVKELMQIAEIQEAESRVNEKQDLEKYPKFRIGKQERQALADRLLDAEHGSAVFENGKIKKVNGKELFTGPVRQEKKAFVVVGRPAGGKSSVFANRLSHDNAARIVDSDVVKPWLSGYDDGYGAGYVQPVSAGIANSALAKASDAGDNIVLPRIGGSSVMEEVVMLREKGYDVQIFYNEVSEQTSIMRAASRFAQEGRYLSLDYLTKIKDKDSKSFRTFVGKKIGDYYETVNVSESFDGSVSSSDVLAGRGSESGSSREDLRRGNFGGGRGSDVPGMVPETGRPERAGQERPAGAFEDELIFSYAEWKSNDVAFGEKPKEIWNSKSGKPMPIKEEKDNGVRSEQGLSRKSSPSGEGERQEGRGTERVREGLGSESNRNQHVRPEHSVTEQPAQPKQAPKHNNKRNNSGERGKDYAPTSPKARFNANVAAIKMMRELIDQDIEAPTKDQMEVLRQYSGWGGLGTFFNDEYSAENKILRDLLDDEEYNAATLSIKTAYYTPAYIIDSLWDIAKAMGFKGGNVLEGSAGIGNIIQQMPKDMSRQSDIEAVEIDKISGNILKLLYPDAKVHIQGFQDTVIRNGSVDLAITNVPFAADLSVIDKVDKDLSRRFRTLHDFCIAKNIRKLREGGIGIFISSSGTLDKSTDLRAWITDEGQADVVGAFRLNNDTFGGTKVTSDIIVVRKRVGGQPSEHSINVSQANPVRVGTYEDKYGDEHQTTMVINDYFKEHPEMMAGEMAFGYEKGDTFRPGSYGLFPVEGKNQEKMMAEFVKSMKGKEEVAVQQQQSQQPQELSLTAVKEGRMLIDDNGRICVSRLGVAVPLGINDQKVKGQTKQQCFKDYQAVQAAVDDVLQQQLNDPNDEALKPKLAALNKAYDLFVKRYGTLHKNTAISFLRNDIDFPSFQALEIYKEEKDIKGKVTVKTSKPKLFSERVIGFKTEPQPKTVKDAVIASIFRTNGIDLEWIAAKLSEVAAPPNGDNWTAEDVRKGILVSRLGFEDPSTGQLVIRYKYLSGNVREKLAIAEQYNTEGDTAGRYAANVEELKKVVPMDIPAHLIDFSLGSSWIPVELYKDFVKETLDLNNVRITHLEGNWAFDEGYSFRNEKNRAAGVYSEKFRETIYGHQLVAAALNNRPVKVSKQVSEGYGANKTTRTVVDQAATQACAVRVDEIKDEFRTWAKKKMQEDPELSRRIEKLYNDKFNALVPMEIGDDFLPERFENANTGITLRPHQKRGTIKGLVAPTMLAHEVGTGKSFTLLSTAMEMRRLGTAKKPMIVVQNATVAQMTADAKLLYPNAKVLSLSEQDRDAEGRRAFYAKIKFNDWDVIIVPQSTFERIPDSPERELQFIQEKIDEKKHVIEAAQAAGVDKRDLEKLKRELEKIEQEYGDKYLDSDPTSNADVPKRKKKDAKREAASLDKAETRAKEQLDRATDDVQFFDDLGVDALLVDEAHEYKHLGFQTSMGRGIKGIDPSYSKKCAGLYNKTRSVFEKAGWKNVVFATGTPISNTAAEIWTFMKYLMPADVMRANDIYYFDDFVHNFGNISQMLEFATNGKFKENTRFAAYVNKPELIRIWSQVADTVRSVDTEVKDKEPDLEGGKDQDIFLPQSPSLIRIMAAVRAELERFENMTGQEKKENSSIPLTMYGIAKRAAIDPRLVDASAPDEPKSKTNAAVAEIVNDLEATKAYKGTVAVFCDNQNRLGVNAAGKKVVDFNIYDDMKAKLIKAGVPEKQIAIIKSGMSITAKQKIFDAVNSGDIRVVLGSTQTLGTGVNMQERLHLLIHMDAPDRPMDYTQRNGRIKRQGNLHKEWGKTIRIVRFGVEDSLDVTAYQRLKTKSGFIDSIMNGKAALANNQVDRTVEEEEEGLFDNPVAVLSGSQYALKKNQAERELRKYQGKKAQWEADQIYVTNQLHYNDNELKAIEANIKEEQKKQERIKSMFPDGTVKTITVEGVKIDMTKDDGAKKLGDAIKEKINDPVNAIVKRNRENAIYNDETLKYTISLDGHDVKFRVEVVRESVWENGKMKTVIHKFTSYTIPELDIDTMTSSRGVRDYLDEIIDQIVTGQDSQDRIDAMQQRVERIKTETEQIAKRVGISFQFDKELEEAKKRVEEYTELMKKEMEEKEAKYAAQQKEAEADGQGFDLNKAEDSEEDNDSDTRYRSMDIFAEGDSFPINKTEAYSNFNVLGTTATYSIELMPDAYTSQQQLLDAVRRQYPFYYARIEDGQVVMESWSHVMSTAENAQQRKDKGSKSYVERKTRNAINAVQSLARRMRLDVEVLTTTDGLEGKKARAKGWFNAKTGKIVIVLPNHVNQSDLINTLLHEGVAHFGLRKMFGSYFNTFLDNVYNNVSPEIKARINAAVKRNGWSRHEATEEYLARLAERTDFEHASKQGWWQKIKDFFVSMLAKAGLVMEEPLTDNELRYILWRSYDNLLHPDSRRNIFDVAQDVVMRQKLGIRRTREHDRLQRTGKLDTSRVAAEANMVGEEMLNRDFDGKSSQELLLSLSQKDENGRNETINELVRRVREGTARIVRMGREIQYQQGSDAQIAGVLVGGWQLGLTPLANEALGSMVQSASPMDGRPASQKQGTPSDSQLAVISWAKATGHYISEDQVREQSLDKKVWREAAESRVYRTVDGKKVIKFTETFVFYDDPLLKRMDGISLHNEAGFDTIRVLGYSEDSDGHLMTVVEQDFVDGVTVDEIFEDQPNIKLNNYLDAFIEEKLGFKRHIDKEGYLCHIKDGVIYKDIHGANVIVDKERKHHVIDCNVSLEKDDQKERTGEFSIEDEATELFSIRTKEPPKKTGIGYKVFVLKDGQLYPPMVANPNGDGTPVGVWLDADAAPIAGKSKTGRPQVKAGGKGTQGGSGQLAYRPGWHLGTIPYALQFNRKDADGERTLFPNNFVWAEVEYADDVDYQDEARQEGINANGKYQHSLAGLKHVPEDGSYKYRTNPDPKTDEWVITGAMRVNKILTREEVDELVRKAGREPQKIQDGDILTQDAVDELNAEIKATKEADEMGLLYRDDEAWVDGVAQAAYEKAVAQNSLKWQEAWQDSMASLKAIQDAIAKETGNIATGAEDAYHFENRMHGRAKNMAERYDWQYYRPMLKAFNDFCKKKGMTHEKGMDYLIAKSGLERNMYYAFRDAMKEKLTEDIKSERETLEKDYAKNRIDEAEYKLRKAQLEEKERTGVDDAIQQLHESLAWKRAREDYENGDITYDELIRRRESLIRSMVGNKYDTHVKDFSGLTETFAKGSYDFAQSMRKDAQQAIDPTTRRMLWAEYNKLMKEAYKEAYQVAMDDVFNAENDAKEESNQLWDNINAATKETLKHSYESGLMERDTYQKVGSMFDYYLPLRGWDEHKASDVYTYMGKENVFSPAVKKTWGRTSKAENPLAYIGNIAMSTILSGHRNQMKQHFLNYVMNNPTSLVNISESWYENIGNEDDHPVWVLRSADTAGKSADEIVDIVNDFNEEMRLKQKEGKAMPVTGRLRLDVHATSGQKAEHVVEVQRAGHTYQLYINGDPKAAQALNGSAARAVSRISDTWLGKKITSINRSMAEFFTSKNPAFIVSNLSRDLNMAGASVAVNEGAAYNAMFIKNVAKVLSPRIAMGDVGKAGLAGLFGRGRGVTGIMPKLMRKYQDGKLNTRNETERLFKEFMEEGGETGFVNMLSVDSFKEKMRKEVAEMNGSTLFGSKAKVKEFSIGKALRLLGDTFEFYNRCAEDATRFIVYMTSRQMGKTLEESIADAKDVTLNFNRKGTGEKGNAELRDLFIFVNPAIQALANMYRMAKAHPLKLGAVTTAFIAGGALMPVINNWLLNMFGDDDDKDAYWNLPPWVRKNNLVFWIPGTKNFVTVPLAQEFRVFYGVGETASSLAMEHPVDRWGLEVFSSVADLVPINPTGNGGNLMVDFAPTMVQPLMQIGENIDFTGRPIWRENQGNKYAPMYTKAYVSTPKWMVKISEGVNSMTGGNEGKKGIIEKYSPVWGDYINNPAVWNHLLQGYFGGMYNTVSKGFDVAVTAASGELPKIYQTPVINRFLNRPVERDNAGALGDDYYHLTEQRDALQYELKIWKKKAADAQSSGDTAAYETAQHHVNEITSSEDWKRAEVITHYEKIIKDLKAGEKATEGEDKQNIKRSISLYKQQLIEELAAIDNGKDPLKAAMEQFDKAKTLSEKQKLKLRIERLSKGDTKKPAESKKAVEKALSYISDGDGESQGTLRYLELATAEDVVNDSRIKAAKALTKPYTQHYKDLTDAGKHKEAAQYRQDNLKWFTASQSINSHERAIASNRKLLGKGNDKAIMNIIDMHRKAMLKSIEKLKE